MYINFYNLLYALALYFLTCCRIYIANMCTRILQPFTGVIIHNITHSNYIATTAYNYTCMKLTPIIVLSVISFLVLQC